MRSLLDKKRPILLAVLALATVPYFFGLGDSSLWDSNEAFYAETPREMIQSGDYINPSFNYQPRFNKPPLCYWVVALFYRWFGVSEKVERVPIALGAMLTVAIAFLLGRRVFSTEAGLFGAIALAATPRFFMFSRRIIIDVYLSMFMGAALLFFILAETVNHEIQPRTRKLYLILTYLSLGLGVMTKGPVALVLPALVFLIYLATTRSLGRIREMMLPGGIAIVLLIVIPWYAVVYEQHGWGYIRSFVLGDNISRYTQPIWGPRRPFWFYIPVLLGDLLPWSIFLVPALLLAVLGKLDQGRRQFHAVAEQKPELLLVIWIAAIVLFFSFSSNKEDLYILPVYPAAAALAGGLLARCTSGESRASRLLPWPAAVSGLLLSAAGAGVLWVSNLIAQAYRLEGMTAIGGSLLIGGLLVLSLSGLKKNLAAVLTLALTVISFDWVLTLRTLPAFERFRPVRALCEEIHSRAGPAALVGYYRLASPSMVFYLEREIFECYDEETLEKLLASNEEVYCVMTAQEYESLKPALAVPTQILASRPMFQVKLNSILKRADPGQVVLISNGIGATYSQ